MHHDEDSNVHSGFTRMVRRKRKRSPVSDLCLEFYRDVFEDDYAAYEDFLETPESLRERKADDDPPLDVLTDGLDAQAPLHSPSHEWDIPPIAHLHDNPDSSDTFIPSSDPPFVTVDDFLKRSAAAQSEAISAKKKRQVKILDITPVFPHPKALESEDTLQSSSPLTPPRQRTRTIPIRGRPTTTRKSKRPQAMTKKTTRQRKAVKSKSKLGLHARLLQAAAMAHVNLDEESSPLIQDEDGRTPLSFIRVEPRDWDRVSRELYEPYRRGKGTTVGKVNAGALRGRPRTGALPPPATINPKGAGASFNLPRQQSATVAGGATRRPTSTSSSRPAPYPQRGTTRKPRKATTKRQRKAGDTDDELSDDASAKGAKKGKKTRPLARAPRKKKAGDSIESSTNSPSPWRVTNSNALDWDEVDRVLSRTKFPPLKMVPVAVASAGYARYGKKKLEDMSLKPAQELQEGGPGDGDVVAGLSEAQPAGSNNASSVSTPIHDHGRANLPVSNQANDDAADVPSTSTDNFHNTDEDNTSTIALNNRNSSNNDPAANNPHPQLAKSKSKRPYLIIRPHLTPVYDPLYFRPLTMSAECEQGELQCLDPELHRR